MTEIFGIPTQALFGQLLIGLINGAFYAMLSLGLAVIFCSTSSTSRTAPNT
jgi:branched-chain amino acid transport system permease protein